MMRPGSLWYNWIYWSRFETLSGYKSSAISHLVIIRLAFTKANSYSNFVTHPPSLWRSFVVLCINKVWGSLLVVRLSLRCHFPRAFGIACILPSYSFALILSDPARKALPVLLSYPTVVGCFCCELNLKSLEPATGLCPPPPLLITTSCSYCLI